MNQPTSRGDVLVKLIDLVENRWGYPDDASSRASILEQARAALSEIEPHDWHCYLDGKHGSREVWKCACGAHIEGNPHICEKGSDGKR